MACFVFAVVTPVVRMSLYAPPLFHFCFPLLPSNLSSHLLTLLATSYMSCKELYGSNVPHLVIPHDRSSCIYAAKDFAARTCLSVATSASSSIYLRSI